VKGLLVRVDKELSPLGYRKRGAAFWKVEDGVYRLVDFQAGAHGRYFFVNVCLHPVGLPLLQAGQLTIPDRPKEYECLIRRRLEECVDNEATAPFRQRLVDVADKEVVDAILTTLPNEVEQWFSHWADLRRLAFTSEAEVVDMLSVVPILRQKAYRMLVFFCSVMVGLSDRSSELFADYTDCIVTKVDLRHVDDYLGSLLSSTPGRTK